MLVEQITSRQNPLVRRAQRVRAGDEPGHMCVEGPRLVDEAVSSGLVFEAVLYTLAFAGTERGQALLARFDGSRCRGAVVPETLMKALCDVETPQGIVAIALQPRYDLDEVLGGQSALVVALESLQDPRNVGAVVRAAEAAGATGVVTTPGTAEPYGVKALRSAMGSAFRLPIARRVDVNDLVRRSHIRGLRLLATASTGGTVYTDVDWTKPSVLFIGSEGAGLSQAARAATSGLVTVPLAEPVESLNAAVAAGVILFEAARQRSRR